MQFSMKQLAYAITFCAFFLWTISTRGFVPLAACIACTSVATTVISQHRSTASRLLRAASVSTVIGAITATIRCMILNGYQYLAFLPFSLPGDLIVSLVVGALASVITSIALRR